MAARRVFLVPVKGDSYAVWSLNQTRALTASQLGCREIVTEVGGVRWWNGRIMPLRELDDNPRCMKTLNDWAWYR
jgi:hypothetical protein